MSFSIGQRWISNTESQLGLGIITDITRRQVSLRFPAAEEERIYAIENAPLSRIIFNEGEELVTSDSLRIIVQNFEENQGIITYFGVDEAGNEFRVDERTLHCFIKLSTPQQRLFSGLLDKVDSFKLRIDTLKHSSRLQLSKVCGLIGSRTSHLPHQVYIASEVAHRYAPRVLLADEVGLGKTIEAGMILHYQLQTGRANRVLIVVPESLIHQWLVEMIRRFNLHFSIINQDRFDDLKNNYDANNELALSSDNVFETEQLVICSLDFLMENQEAHKQVLESEWDLLIVDEAHHLRWSVDAVSPEYAFIENLSRKSKGLLLLTATPEQAGIESHFARLRLIDPSRFHDFKRFKKEEDNYQQVNILVQSIIEEQQIQQSDDLSEKLVKELRPYLGESTPASASEAIKCLLDRHGTGRVLFRNTRSAIEGFPERCLHSYPLPCPAIINKDIGSLFPEEYLDPIEWIKNDPRINWLANKITELRPEKVLVICSNADTALDLEQYLKIKAGIRSTAFHEGLTIIQRDKAAAYFSEIEQGAQALICSEIGSEGRNFQFAHHLILFDLPVNPDLLEQRIGRLDRIGQQHTIQIHVPYLEETAQETLFRWYNEGINSFEKSCSIGFSIYELFEKELITLLAHFDAPKLEELIQATKTHAELVNQKLAEGRDKLLELNSCNLLVAEELIADIETEENSLALQDYMARVFHEYGIDQEYHSEVTEILHPTDHMKTSHFPGLNDDSITVTYSRAKALIREDMAFLSWEHPMVHDSMEMILDSELGNATLVTISVKSIAPGTLFLETFFTVNCAAPKYLQLGRFLPLIPIRILMDVSGKNLSKILDFNQLNGMCQPVKGQFANVIIKQIRTEVEGILEKSSIIAEERMLEGIELAKTHMRESIGQELNRLEALQKINPTIREDEIQFLKQQIIDSDYFISNATLKLQAVRVVINK